MIDDEGRLVSTSIHLAHLLERGCARVVALAVERSRTSEVLGGRVPFSPRSKT